ncbi:hypothetical protein [Lentzea sp. CA-135723]|uniref:hypothetical protein n=1 Tax=Lentzea sp. CA-135723 TaxID=3239950 RepID=UPI003D930AF2
MGSRANYVIVDERGCELYIDSDGAVGLLREFAEGPEAVIESVRESFLANGWLDDIWCEGAAVIDTLNQVLVLYSLHHDGVDARARQLTAIRAAWPEWQVRWAYGGIGDVVAYVGLGRASVRSEMPSAHAELQPTWNGRPTARNCLVTVQQADGSVQGHLVRHSYFKPVWETADLLDALAELTPSPGWEPQSADDSGPDHGLHFDLARRTFGFWTVMSFTETVDEIAARWPGWTVEFWEDRHEEQAQRAGDFRTFPFETVL